MNRKNFEDHVNPLDGVVQEIPMGRDFVDVGSSEEALLDEKPASNVPEVDAIIPVAVIGTNTGSVAALLNHEESEHFRTLWNEIQGKFVDEPRSAVQQADALVSNVIEKITKIFANEHSSLEEQWKEGKDVSTEDLRKALQHYRSFFNRLVV